MSPTLVLLPGLDGTGRLFAPVRACLGDRFAAVAVSYPADRCVAREDLQRCVDAAVPTAGDYVLVAESFSGALAIAHAARRPARLVALVLVASFAANPLPRGLRWLGRFAGVARLRLPRFLVRPLLVGGRAEEDLVDAVKATVDSVAPAVVVDRLRQVMTVDVCAQLAAVAVPVLYLHGRNDRLVGARGLARCRRALPGLTAVSIAGPHLLLQRRPRECVEAIARFLAANAPPAPPGR